MIRILYGVQATGQGHISRARAMAKALASYPNLEITWLFSGRPKDKLFDMEPFGDYQHRSGLTFVTEAGRLRYRRTIASNSYWAFIKDILKLDLDRFDLIVTDYEPVTAWAGLLARRPVIGIGHQYAFGKNTPTDGCAFLQKIVMSCFAPVSRKVGLHWHNYDNNILPPILDLPEQSAGEPRDHVLVYLPFEDQTLVTNWLNGFRDHNFIQYSSALGDGQQGNVALRKASIFGFKTDLAQCRGVICNSGFELISECLQWGRPVLTRPLDKQIEQLSNSVALKTLGYAKVMGGLDNAVTPDWLANPPAAPKVNFPNVSHRLAEWLAQGAQTPIASISDELWTQERT